jgi:hypothetical protein
MKIVSHETDLVVEVHVTIKREDAKLVRAIVEADSRRAAARYLRHLIPGLSTGDCRAIVQELTKTS